MLATDADLQGRLRRLASLDAHLDQAADPDAVEDHERVTVDVEHADCASTVGMALLLEWSTWSSACGTKLSYTNASSRLIDMVKLNDVEDLLQFTETRS